LRRSERAVHRPFRHGHRHQTEADAYRAIAGALGFPPQEILFLSDVEAELAAAREAGLAVTLLARGGLPSAPSYPVVADFDTLLP
jgi:enolase-phosphatase E1